jgi:malic enzyme
VPTPFDPRVAPAVASAVAAQAEADGVAMTAVPAQATTS